MSVCKHISGAANPNFTAFQCIQPVAVALFSSTVHGVAVYVMHFQFLWMTSLLSIISKASAMQVWIRKCSDPPATGSTGLSICTHQNTIPDQGRSLICLFTLFFLFVVSTEGLSWPPVGFSVHIKYSVCEVNFCGV